MDKQPLQSKRRDPQGGDIPAREGDLRRPPALLTPRELARLGFLTVLLTGAKFAVSWLPNIELVSLLVILYTLHLGHKALYPIYAFVVLEGVLYGFSPTWWISYLYLWALLHLAVMLFRNNPAAGYPLFWALLSGAFGLLFGTLGSIPNIILLRPTAGLAYLIANIPFDIAHCVGNLLLCLLLFRILDRFFQKALGSR